MSEICSHASFSQWKPWRATREEGFWTFTHDDAAGHTGEVVRAASPRNLREVKTEGSGRREWVPVFNCDTHIHTHSLLPVWAEFHTYEATLSPEIKTKKTGKTCFLCRKSQRTSDTDVIFKFSSKQQLQNKYLTHLSLPPALVFHASGGGEEEKACRDKNNSRWNQIHTLV